MNRITTFLFTIQAKIDNIIDEDKIDKLDKAMDLTIHEHAHHQNLKSLAVADGRLTTDEGMTLYRILGGSYLSFNKKPTAEKVVVSQIMAELLGVA